MTQEEKLEEAKRLYKDANADQRYVLERLFPELEESEKESEDERIIRSLKEIVTAAFSIERKEVLVSINGLKKDDLIAWLEKNKNIDEVESNENGLIADTIKYKNKPKFGVGDFISYNGNVYEVVGVCNLFDDEYRLKNLKTNRFLQANVYTVDNFYHFAKGAEKKESKETEHNSAWTEEDEGYYNSIIEHLKYSITNGKPETYRSGRLTDWLKSLKEIVQLRRNTWKPTEEQCKPIDKEKVLICARRDIALSIMKFLDRNTLGMCLSGMERADLESAVMDSDWSKLYDYMKKKLEKQGEQTNNLIQQEAMDIAVAKCFDEGESKSTDKLEPDFNFKVGQWIVATGKCAYLIVKIDGFNVTLVDTNGDESVFDVSSLNDAHLWTVDDAQDGDVLFEDKMSTLPSPFIVIFKKKDSVNTISSHCFIGFDGKFYEGEDYHYSENLHPAIKEQRDILEKAMTDAGWKFDFKKKELKKIEDEPNKCEGCNNAKGCVACVNGSEWAHIEEQNSTWSEDDERNRQGIIDEIEANKHSAPDYDFATYDRFLSWLKSLKERVQSQNTWKPSDEQMRILSIYADQNNTHGSVLTSLYQDLKKKL